MEPGSAPPILLDHADLEFKLGDSDLPDGLFRERSFLGHL